MCLLMSIHGPKAASKTREFVTADQPELDFPTYYVASGFDHPKWPVITSGKALSVALPCWGLIPNWVKTTEEATRIRNQTLNARGETIASKPAFRQSAKSNRCIILLDGFFEYYKRDDKSYPFYIHLRGEEVFLVAGLCAAWVDPRSQETVSTFSLVTIEANGMMAAIHNDKKRMPAILTDQEALRWLEPAESVEELQGLLQPHDIADLTAHPVSRVVGSHSRERNVATTQDRFEYPELGGMNALTG